MKKNDSVKLVTVLVITYNSERTVLETLTSILHQDYHKLELVIADDGSYDNTVNICKEWLSENNGRFVTAKIVNSQQNTGTCSNLNRGTKASCGDFIKIIAGDDVLESNCISTLVERIGAHDMIFSGLTPFDENGVVATDENTNYYNAICRLNPTKRLKLYCRTMWFMTPPTQMYRRSIFEVIGFYDESSKIIEDVPFWVSFLSSDLKVIFIEDKTVRYRLAGVSHTPHRIVSMQRLLSETFFKYCRPHLSLCNPIDFLVIFDAWIWRLVSIVGVPFLIKLYGSKYNIGKRLLTLVLKIQYSFPLLYR